MVIKHKKESVIPGVIECATVCGRIYVKIVDKRSKKEVWRSRHAGEKSYEYPASRFDNIEDFINFVNKRKIL